MRVVVSRPRGGLSPAWLAIRHRVRRAGGEPFRVQPGDRLPPPEGALILSGGAHVHPAAYEQLPLFAPTRYDRARDRLEFALARGWMRAELPVLGICRGLQLAVVAHGGTLVQDVWERRRRRRRSTVVATRYVRLDPSSRLAGLLGRTELHVNSMHRQAVATLPRGWRAVAWDQDGLIQAVEAPGFVGVQWHPEYLPGVHGELFRWLLRAVPEGAAAQAHQLRLWPEYGAG